METLSALPILCGENRPVVIGYTYETDNKWKFGSSFVAKQQNLMNKY